MATVPKTQKEHVAYLHLSFGSHYCSSEALGGEDAHIHCGNLPFRVGEDDGYRIIYTCKAKHSGILNIQSGSIIQDQIMLTPYYLPTSSILSFQHQRLDLIFRLLLILPMSQANG